MNILINQNNNFIKEVNIKHKNINIKKKLNLVKIIRVRII